MSLMRDSAKRGIRGRWGSVVIECVLKRGLQAVHKRVVLRTQTYGRRRTTRPYSAIGVISAMVADMKYNHLEQSMVNRSDE